MVIISNDVVGIGVPFIISFLLYVFVFRMPKFWLMLCVFDCLWNQGCTTATSLLSGFMVTLILCQERGDGSE